MDFSYTEDDIAFREEIRRFVKDNVPPDMAKRSREHVHTPKQDLQAWNRILNQKGWAAPHWPVEYGGTGWTPLQIHIFEEECAAGDAPFLSYFGLRLVGPLIYTFGSEVMKRELLPPILSGETFWCQGFSEPASGSDLASVRTTAVRDGDSYVINGQKLWTTEAHFADKMFCLVRTDRNVRPQKGGLSMLIVDMTQPGVSHRPVITIDGGHSVNEVFLDDVRVPASNLLGAEGQGWDQAKFLLGNERVANAHVPRSKRELALLKACMKERLHERPPATRAAILEKLARIEIDLSALEWSVLRELAEDEHNHNSASTSGLKLLGSEIEQRIGDLTIELMGEEGVRKAQFVQGRNSHDQDGMDEVTGPAARQLFLRATTIYAGTSEIQKEIISRQLM